MNNRSVFLLVLFAANLLFCAAANAQDYYADVSFDIDEKGITKISGLADYPAFSERETSEFTSKKGSHWAFNATTTEKFTVFTYTVYLPEGAEINYVKASTQMRIGSAGGRTFIKGVGRNETFSIVVQYSFAADAASKQIASASIFALFVLVLIVLAAWLVMKKARNISNEIKSHPHKIREKEEPDAQSEVWYNKSILPERQRKIIDILEKSKRPMTQKEIENMLKLPKSSVSRNVDSLAIRGIVKKEQSGMTNVLTINPKKPEI